ncbi:hypothetical protein [Streptomyces sp. NPDC059552]|uniref:hypothetical protein n=1 Tax=Streptomyces sp. NPDC059552 TaxID=3346862 RepID=UPI0036C73AFA
MLTPMGPWPPAPGADAPVGTQPVLIEWSAPRLFCNDNGCAGVTFAEQVEGWLTAVTVGE